MTMMRAIVFGLLVVVALPCVATAQQRPAQPSPQRRAQRVDSLTASITGKVVTADTGTPIRGAEVRLSSDGHYSRLGTTDGEGRFELRDLPAAEYRLTVSRTGFITMQYGQRRPFETSSSITLAEGATAEANVALTRGGVIYGRVLDQFGEPLAGTRVQALRGRIVQGQRRVQTVGVSDQTDDTGAFRIYGLPPGDYYVIAAAGFGEQAKRDPPTYFPGTANFAAAQTITLAPGLEAAADFQIGNVRNARVTGIVINSSGRPMPAMVNLNSENINTGPTIEGSSAAAMQVHADAGPDGKFTLENVPPGPYTLTAMLMQGLMGPDTMPSSGPPTVRDMLSRVPESVAMPIVVNGDDINDVTMVTRPPAVLNGSFVADTGVTRRLPQGLRVSARSLNMSMIMTMGSADGSGFQMVGITGPVTLVVQGVPAGWTVKEMLLDGRDVIDESIDLQGQNGALRIVMSDRPSSVVGTVMSRGEPVDHAVVVFPEDGKKWTFPSRFIRTTRADAEGRFRIADLPAGERYLAAAIDHIEDGEQDDTQFLERLRGRAASFSLSEGEQRALSLETASR
jgi:Carboxypeptidase regulatory-like domain